MSRSYRLASARHGGARSVFIERKGQHYRLADLLQDADRARLGATPPEDLMPLIKDWSYWSAVLGHRLEDHLAKTPTGRTAQELTFCPPVALPNKLICIGSNYRDHIEEMKIPMLPTYPYSFLKPASTTLRGSGEDVAIPAIAEMVDWEAELAIIIAQPTRNIDVKDALSAVAGYSNLNDLSARDWLASRPAVGIDWIKHKAFDGFAPMGPYLLPAAFMRDPQDLPIRLSVNGVVKQSSNTAQMVFGVAQIIAYLSGIMTLEPGDVIATGTPAGVGHGRNPQEFLKAGDIVQMEIGELGVLDTPMV